jgi:hypothetical protein
MADDAAKFDVLCKQIFLLFEKWPRFKDLVFDPMAAAAASGDAAASGAMVLRGQFKMLHTVANLVGSKANKSSTTEARFKVLASKSKWVAAGEALTKALEGAAGQEGLQERLGQCTPSQFVVVVMEEMESGEVRCQQSTASGVAGVQDCGPWEFVLDHGESRTDERPKFAYNGSLVPYRVSPDRPLPEHIVKPDYCAAAAAQRAASPSYRLCAAVAGPELDTPRAHDACARRALRQMRRGRRRRSGGRRHATRRRCIRRSRSRRCARPTCSAARYSTLRTPPSAPASPPTRSTASCTSSQVRGGVIT